MNIEIKIAPFEIPRSVTEIHSDPRPPAPPSHFDAFIPDYIAPRQFQLNELSAGDLESMCIDFTNKVFRRANKKQPERDCEAPARVTVPSDVLKWAEQFRHAETNNPVLGAVGCFILRLAE